jgi:hypothetical protein
VSSQEADVRGAPVPGRGRVRSIVSLALGVLAAVGSVPGGIRLLTPSALPFPMPVWVAMGVVVFPSFFAGIPAVIAGIVALARRGAGAAMAIAGIVLGLAGTLLWAAVCVVFIARTPI